jgi:hypothetical protein
MTGDSQYWSRALEAIGDRLMGEELSHQFSYDVAQCVWGSGSCVMGNRVSAECDTMGFRQLCSGRDMAKEKFQMTVYLNSMCPIEVHEANVG